MGPPLLKMFFKNPGPVCKSMKEAGTLEIGRSRIFVPVCYFAAFFVRYSSMACAAFLPAPMARMTVAAPVTMSPPA